ncbi:MAG: class I SAM-dependent methyltransferase [Firmicutes bacterium]|nr:class I SAM-dependent methyltransferase [Bacillota bacterium]
MNDYEYSDKMEHALQYLKDRYGEEGLQYRSVLDLCCGAGCFMPQFSGLFSSVTGLEPDPERCDEAMELILDKGLENATALCMDLEEYIREFPNQTFDIVFCCDMFQSIKHETACNILENLKHVIGPDSVCLFTTTFTDGRRNEYAAEYLQDSAAMALTLDEKGFEEAVDAQDKHAVCLFARPWMERFLQSCGLITKHFETYDAASALYICEPAEGTLLRRSCGPETASGKVCFQRFYYLNNAAGMNTAGLRNCRAGEGEDVEEIREAFDTAENYLYGGKLPFSAQRHYRKTEVRCEKVSIADSHLIVSFYPENGIAQVSVCFNLEDAPCDNFVYLRRISGAEEAPFTADGKPVSVPQLCEDILKECGLRNLKKGPAYVITELNRFGSCADPSALSAGEKRCLYGMLTGDEAYLHVPADFAEERLAHNLSALDFVRVIASEDSCLLLNFNRGETYADYIDYQIPYAERYFGGLNDYFTMDAPTAGVDHGLYFSAEKGLLTRTAAQRLAEDVRLDQHTRAELNSMIDALEKTAEAQPGSMDGLVLCELGVPGSLESVRGMLEQAASDLDLRYSRSTNRMVTVLTILGILYALFRVVSSL